MRMRTKNYLAKNIVWKRTTDPHLSFAVEFEDKKCAIKLNNFPDQHLYTLIPDGKEDIGIDDGSSK